MSEDDKFDGVRMGAFTWGLHKVLREVSAHSSLTWLMRRVQETLDEAGYPQMPQLAARLRKGENLEDYHFFESLQDAADAVGLAESLPVDAR